MKLRKSLSFLLSLFFLSSQSAQAEGELMVMPASTRLYNSHEQKVTVKNVGDAPLYLSISVQKVTNPGLTPEKKLDLGQVPHPGLLANPNKLALGPNQSRAIVLKSLMEPEQEELYRLYVLPVRELKIEDAPQDKITAPMSVAIGYGVMVRHMPAPGRQRKGWTHRCENGGLTLINTGNVRQIFQDVTTEKGISEQTLALFPGIPQHFLGKRMILHVGNQTQTLDCP